ncbi:tyrosine-type recombinase/integrase [Bradyrhizobium sp. TZ2]
MARIHFTERVIAKLPAPDPSGQQAYHWDSTLKGFGVVCSGSTNGKAYIVQRDIGGRSKRLKIGAVAELPLAKARLRAAEVLDDLRQGILPTTKADLNITLKGALESYLASTVLRPPSIRAYRMIERTLADWMDWPLRTISADAIEKRHKDLGDKIGGHTANASLRTLRIVWNHIADRTPDFPVCPVVRRLKGSWFEEKRRTRMVTNDQLADFYGAVTALPNQIEADCIKLLMFTGMRRTECTSLRWENIDLKGRTINLPAVVTKGNRACSLPMSDLVFDLLVARRALGKDRFVFPSSSRSGHILDLQWAFDAIEKQTGIMVSSHDMRRSFVTTAESIGVPLSIIKGLVNHSVKGGDLTQGYIVVEPAKLRTAQQMVTDKLKELCRITGPVGENVKKLARK